jgi:hypothetical protein
MSTPEPQDALTEWLEERDRIRAGAGQHPVPVAADAIALADAYRSLPVLAAMVRAALAVGTNLPHNPELRHIAAKALADVREAMFRALPES